LPAAVFAVLWIVTTLSWRLPGLYSLIGFVSFFALAPVQQHINRINTLVAPEHDRNARLSGWNWLAVIVGGALQVLLVIGLLRTPSDV
jgi:hypothetical protein